MILLFLFSFLNNMVYILLEDKLRLRSLYELKKRPKFPNWCELCILGWLSLTDYAIFNFSQGIVWIFTLYLIFSFFVHSFALWFISLCVRRVYLILKRLHEHPRT